MKAAGPPLTFAGHPYASIGMGAQLRSHVAAARAVHLDPGVVDIFRAAPRTDFEHQSLIERCELQIIPGGIRVFHVNGDEVPRALAAFASRGGDFSAGINVIVPAWELPQYPTVWARELARFDEVWAISRFVQEALSAAGVPAHLVGQSVEAADGHGAGPLLPRRSLGLRESAFILLHFFDASSYAERKNPLAVLEVFRRLRAAEPLRDMQLVLKAKDAEGRATAWGALAEPDPLLKLIDAPLDSLATRSLLAACDCFVSLHRSEGFGRGLGEAMALGRLAMGTGWSGNLDFMTETNSLLVTAGRAPVAAGAYPFGEGQSWAEPDLDHAVVLLREAMANPAATRARAATGQRDVLRSHGNRAVGLRIAARVEALAGAATGRSRPRPRPT